MDVAAARRFSRHLALGDIGAEAQERFFAAEVALVGDGLIIETAARYLAGAGVGAFRMVAPGTAAGERLADVAQTTRSLAQTSHHGWPVDGPAWVEALASVSLIVRSGFDDDPMLRAAVRLGVPVVVTRVAGDAVDVLAFRKHGPCPHVELDFAEDTHPRRFPFAGAREGVRVSDGAQAVVAGTLVATEVLWMLARPGELPRARHLRIAGTETEAQEIPWSPECFSCGGSATEMVFA